MSCATRPLCLQGSLSFRYSKRSVVKRLLCLGACHFRGAPNTDRYVLPGTTFFLSRGALGGAVRLFTALVCVVVGFVGMQQRDKTANPFQTVSTVFSMSPLGMVFLRRLRRTLDKWLPRERKPHLLVSDVTIHGPDQNRLRTTLGLS